MLGEELPSTEEAVLGFLKGKDWTSPTLLGRTIWGPGHHSSSASPLCLRLVKAGKLERNKNGHYRLPPQQSQENEELEELLANIAAAPGNDPEIEALQEIIWGLWKALPPEVKADKKIFSSSLKDRAAQWAKDQTQSQLPRSKLRGVKPDPVMG